MELVLIALPFVAFLACPLMMLFCVVGMRKMGGSSPRTGDSQVASVSRPEQVASVSPPEQVAALQRQLQAIQGQLAALPPADAPVRLAPATVQDVSGRWVGSEVGHEARQSA